MNAQALGQGGGAEERTVHLKAKLKRISSVTFKMVAFGISGIILEMNEKWSFQKDRECFSTKMLWLGKGGTRGGMSLDSGSKARAHNKARDKLG